MKLNFANLRHLLAQNLLALGVFHQFHGSAHQVFLRRNQVQAFDTGIQNDILDGDVVHHGVVNRTPRRVAGETQAARRVRLRIAIDHQGPHVQLGKCCPQTDGRGGLAHSTLLIGNRDYFSQIVSRNSEFAVNLTELVIIRKFRGHREMGATGIGTSRGRLIGPSSDLQSEILELATESCNLPHIVCRARLYSQQGTSNRGMAREASPYEVVSAAGPAIEAGTAYPLVTVWARVGRCSSSASKMASATAFIGLRRCRLSRCKVRYASSSVSCKSR